MPEDKWGYYEFTVTIRGRGKNPDGAWMDAFEAFSMDPGSTPEEYEFEPDPDEETDTREEEEAE